MKKDLSGLRIDRSQTQDNSGNSRFWLALSLVLLVVVVILAIYSLRRGSEARPDESRSVGGLVDPTPDPEDLSQSREVLVASGYVVAHHKHELGTKVMGRVAWIGVEKGDFVRKDQLLVKLEDREYRARLEQSKAALTLAETRLEELEAGSRPEEIEQGEAELQRSIADLDNARVELSRLEKLLCDGAVSEQQVDDGRSRFQMAEATVKAAQKRLELLRLGPRRERIEQARAEVKEAEANVNYAQTMLDATEIRAPVTGTVLRRIAEVGEMITTSFAGDTGAKSAVVALADLSDLQVELDISQTDFNRISRDQACSMTPEAYPERRYPCEIDEISPEADRQKASIQVKVKVLHPDEYLRPEMSARVTFFRDETDDESATN